MTPMEGGAASPLPCEQLLWPDGTGLETPQVFAVVDAARDPRIIGMLRASEWEPACLFSGALSPALQAAAPYLVHLAPDDRLTRQLLASGWDEAWFTLCIVPLGLTLEQLRRHLRTLLRVRDERGRQLMFRLFDPRVLAAYLPTCNAAELALVFGPVAAFVVPAPDGRLTSFSHHGHVLSESDVPRMGDSAAGSGPYPGELRELVVREAQMTAFAARPDLAFTDSMVDRIRRHLPDDVERLGEPRVREVVQLAIRKGKAYGLESRAAVSGLVLLMVSRGADFDEREENDWIRGMLDDRTVDAETRIAMILDRDEASSATDARRLAPDLPNQHPGPEA